MSSGLYNEGLFREGLLRTTNLVRPGLITQFDTLEETLTRFAVNGVEAALALDFIASEYRTANTSTTFADAFTGTSPKLTYSTSAGSNSTMTQGYGPELVENGGFTTDTDWTKGNGWTISGGVATCDGTNATQLTLANKVTAGSVYQVEFDVTSYTSGNLRVVLGTFGDIVPTISSLGRKTVVQTASSDGSLGLRSASFNGSLDNISVREAPKIVWGPHNLLDYSEDFSNAAWTKQGSTAIDSTLVTGPDGTLSGRRLLDFDSGTSDRLVGRATITNATVTCSLWVKGEGSNIGKDIQLKAKRVGGTFVQTTVLHTLTADWERIHATFTQDPSNTGARLALSNPVNGNEASEVLIYGAHIYRSDLGGMAQVPGAATGFEYYVPTNGNAEYLPRVGHHVFNGSAWVNEGLLIESEPRTNLVTHSDFSANWTEGRTTLTPNAVSGLDGNTSAATLIEDTTTAQHKLQSSVAVSAGSDYTWSLVVKANGRQHFSLYPQGGTSASAKFDLSAVTSLNDVTTNLVGHGVKLIAPDKYLCWITFTTTGTTVLPHVYLRDSSGATSAPTYTGDGNSGLIIETTQLDQGQVVNGTPVDAPTPSSYIPTNGSTVIRGGQSLVVPAHWYDVDNPTYTGPELVTNGGFDTDTDWTKGTGWAISGGVATKTAGTGSWITNDGFSGAPYIGSILEVTWTVSGSTAGTTRSRWTGDTFSGNGTHVAYAVVDNGNDFGIITDSAFDGSIDNISVRQVSAPQFGWPEPEYIGPELVVDGSGNWVGDFDVAADVSEWADLNSTSVWGAGKISVTYAFTASGAYKSFPTEAGKVYMAQATMVSKTGTSQNGPLLRCGDGGTPDAGLVDSASLNDGQTATVYFVATGSTSYVYLRADQIAAEWDNISVREINPLSVSIQMDGRMTYADTASFNEVEFYRHRTSNGQERINAEMSTFGAYTGRLLFNSTQGGSNETSQGDAYSPGVLVPFNISSRHGSTFVNGAVDGVALTADTTPTALPDLSSTNLEIAQDFMGTIGTFRQFAGDIGDTGLVTATDPSTEPTLSLTFDGTGGSFYNLNWSE